MRKIAMTHPQSYHKSELHCENTMPSGPPAGSEYTKVEAILGKSPKILNILKLPLSFCPVTQRCQQRIVLSKYINLGSRIHFFRKVRSVELIRSKC
jgi:hypothetical protein